MSSLNKNLSKYSKSELPSASGMSFGIAVSEWNSDVTNKLFKGALSTLLENGVKKNNITIIYVPGSFELPIASQLLIDNNKIDAVICIGCIIQGETRHFEFICNSVSQGIKDVSLKYNKPVVFGVLTTENLSQAKERSGGKLGNKGIEAAITAIKMTALKKALSRKKL